MRKPFQRDDLPPELAAEFAAMSPQERAFLERALQNPDAAQRGIYLRSLIIAGAEKPTADLGNQEPLTLSKDPVMLLQEILYGLQCAYTSLFGLAGLNGLPPEELEKISSQLASRASSTSPISKPG